MIEVAHVLGRDAQRDHDLRERVALLEALEHARRELALRHLRRAHHGLLRVARRALQLHRLRESLDVGRLEAPHALVVDQRVESRAFEAAHGGDADVETPRHIVARERGLPQVVIGLLRGGARCNTQLRHPDFIP